VQVLPVPLEIDDRIADQLPRAVEGDVATAFHFEEFDATPPKLRLGGHEMPGLRPAAKCDDGRMLDQQQQVVAKDTANSRAGRRALQLQRGAVRHGAKVDDRQFHG